MFYMTKTDFLKTVSNPKFLLFTILLVGGLLRFWGLGSAEIFHDEGFYTFRSFGYLDYIQNDDQTTPIQWFRDSALPSWTKLSFHDHPPLYFLIQHSSFIIFGDSLGAARLPSAVFGTLSILLLYFIAKRILKNEYGALIAAAIFSITHVHAWVSRSSLMEGVQLFFILLNILFFIKFLENRKYFYLFGVTAGLMLLTKYTSLFLIPVYFIYAIISRRDIFKSVELYAATTMALVIFSPVIYYNYELYKFTGHFDLQLAYLLGEETPEWRASFGKVQDPFSDIGINMLAMYSIPFLVLFLLGVIYSIFSFKKLGNNWIIFGWLSIAFIDIMLVAIGSAYRFLSLYSIFAVFFVALGLYFIREKVADKYLTTVIVSAFLIYEVFFLVDGLFLTFPDFGVKKLDDYLSTATYGKRSLGIPQSPNRHLDAIIKKYALRLPEGDKYIAIIYDENIALSSKLWLFGRRTMYKGITAMTTKFFRSVMQEKGLDFFKDYEMYFVKASPHTSLNPNFSTNDAEIFENFLVNELSIRPHEIIYGHKSLPMFTVYKFKL